MQPFGEDSLICKVNNQKLNPYISNGNIQFWLEGNATGKIKDLLKKITA